MKAADIILLIILAFGAYQGFKKGLFLEIVTFLAFIIAILSAFKLLNTGIEYLKSSLSWESVLLPYAAFVLIFLLVFLGIHLLGVALKKVLSLTLLGPADNIAGGLLGMVKMGFALSMVLWLTRAAQLNIPEEYVKETYLYIPMTNFAPLVVHYVSYVIPFQNIFPAIQKILQYSAS